MNAKITVKVFFAMCFIALRASCAAADFTFIHISDEHASSGPTTRATIAELGTLSSIHMEPYGVDAVPPSFVIETGDLTEFGPKNGAWDLLNTWYSAVKLPRYRALGNHDCTWRSLTPEMIRLYGSPYYSFDKFGCHFVVLDTAGLQDPRPLLSPEELDWLRNDLKRVGPQRPVFLAMHHPLDCQEFASIYEVDRLVDLLRPYNVVLVMVGHGHNVRFSNYDGLDMVEGGSAFGPGKPGYQVVSVIGGRLRVAFKEVGSPAAVHAMIDKPLARQGMVYPRVSIQLPRERSSYAEHVPVKSWIGFGKEEVSSAYVEIDGSIKFDLTQKPTGSFDCKIDASTLSLGAHSMRVYFKASDGSLYHRSCSFYTDSVEPRAKWRVYMGAAGKSRPATDGRSVFVGTNDGIVRAFDAGSGKAKWVYRTGGAVTGEPLVIDGRVYFGSEDGNLYCASAPNGKLVWKFTGGRPIYSSPVSDGVSVYFGAADGTFYSLSLDSGKLNWKNTSATYNIECKPFIDKGRVYYGCWDTYLYCLNTSDGALVWKCVGQGSSEGTAPAYYSPADCGPVVCGDKVYAADRKYRLSVIDISSGALTGSIDNVSAVGLSTDRSSIYLRRTDGNLVKLDHAGRQVWPTSVSMDIMPAAPVESGGVVYVCSKSGLVSAVSSADGKVIWQYNATPGSFVYTSVGMSDRHIYVSGSDGVLTALSHYVLSS